ncbi:hypothetical protein DERF_003970 [Dermatophagoides farinae]|uniref:Uncharacterized protein n=2 Tax=Dermatophagoides farinae TaxID=6954 RepID=A0A922LCT7_DERFA|nr:hypothetical protein DERF_003970 [Dermatophagoides farinae]
MANIGVECEKSSDCKIGNKFSYLSSCKKCCFVVTILLAILSLILTFMFIFFFDFLIKIINLAPGTTHLNDTNRNIFELIESRGFQYESHFLNTGNGYIIQLVRIINPYSSSDILPPPVFLQHGFQTNGNQWLINRNGYLDTNGDYYEMDPDNNDELIIDKNESTCSSLGFVLANRGYDVWLGNYRGSIYSTNHTTLDIHSAEFWSFSIDNLVDEDLKSTIDYVRNMTNRKSISYVGHSQGAFMMFALLAKHPEYSDYIRPFIALAPVFYMSKMELGLMNLFPMSLMEKLLRIYPREFPMFRKLIILLSNCCENILYNRICFAYLHLLNGYRYEESYKDRVGIYVNNIVTGSSSWNVAHFLQIIMANGQPRHFDFFDDQLNGQHYDGRIRAPEYNASNIRSQHIAIVYSPIDKLNAMVDIEKLKSTLNVKLMDDYMLPENVSHIGMIWSKDAGQLINKRIVQILTRYYNEP